MLNIITNTFSVARRVFTMSCWQEWGMKSRSLEVRGHWPVRHPKQVTDSPHGKLAAGEPPSGQKHAQVSDVGFLSIRGHGPWAPFRIASGHVLLFAEPAPACLGSGGQCPPWLDLESGAQGHLPCVSIHCYLPLSIGVCWFSDLRLVWFGF